MRLVALSELTAKLVKLAFSFISDFLLLVLGHFIHAVDCLLSQRSNRLTKCCGLGHLTQAGFTRQHIVHNPAELRVVDLVAEQLQRSPEVM